MFVTARFWASIAQLNEARGRYDVRGVMGPDEFHDRLKIVPRNPVAPQIDTIAFSVMVDARRLWSRLVNAPRLDSVFAPYSGGINPIDAQL